MIKNVIDLLNANEFYGISQNIEIAKGKYALPIDWNDSLNKIKRHRKMKKEPITWKGVWNKLKQYRWQTRK